MEVNEKKKIEKRKKIMRKINNECEDRRRDNG
jgi:hypothetical protein